MGHRTRRCGPHWRKLNHFRAGGVSDRGGVSYEKLAGSIRRAGGVLLFRRHFLWSAAATGANLMGGAFVWHHRGCVGGVAAAGVSGNPKFKARMTRGIKTATISNISTQCLRQAKTPELEIATSRVHANAFGGLSPQRRK